MRYKEPTELSLDLRMRLEPELDRFHSPRRIEFCQTFDGAEGLRRHDGAGGKSLVENLLTQGRFARFRSNVIRAIEEEPPMQAKVDSGIDAQLPGCRVAVQSADYQNVMIGTLRPRSGPSAISRAVPARDPQA